MTEYDSDSGVDEDLSRHPEGVEPLGCKFASKDGGCADIRAAGELMGYSSAFAHQLTIT